MCTLCKLMWTRAEVGGLLLGVGKGSMRTCLHMPFALEGGLTEEGHSMTVHVYRGFLRQTVPTYAHHKVNVMLERITYHTSENFLPLNVCLILFSSLWPLNKEKYRSKLYVLYQN